MWLRKSGGLAIQLHRKIGSSSKLFAQETSIKIQYFIFPVRFKSVYMQQIKWKELLQKDIIL